MSDNTKQIYNYTVILEKESDGGCHAFCYLLRAGVVRHPYEQHEK